MEIVIITSGGHEVRLYNVSRVDISDEEFVRFMDAQNNVLATFFKPNLAGWVYVDNNKFFKE